MSATPTTRRGSRRANRHDTVYLAAPITTFKTPRYDNALALLRDRHPDARILSPRELFSSNEDWREKWPSLLPTINRLYMLTDQYGYITPGVRQEYHDCFQRRVPIAVIDQRGDVLLDFDIPTVNEWRSRWAVERIPDILRRREADGPQPDARMMTATFYDKDGNRHDGCNYRGYNIFILSLYQAAVDALLAGDGGHLLRDFVTRTPYPYVNDTRGGGCVPLLIDAAALLRMGEPVIITRAHVKRPRTVKKTAPRPLTRPTPRPRLNAACIAQRADTNAPRPGDEEIW